MWEYKRPEKGFFTPAQRKQVEVLFDGIFPPGQNNPGARDCTAAEYLDYLLADPSVYYEISQWQSLYAVGLDWLDSVARLKFAHDLSELSPQQCTALLNDLAAAKLSDSPVGFNQAQFFATLRAHCIEGCFADQRWGGNRGNVIWQWYGYPSGPACDFDRSRNPPLSPWNKAPKQSPQYSGNTATASKDPLLNESATVPPLLLSWAIDAERELEQGATKSSERKTEGDRDV